MKLLIFFTIFLLAGLVYSAPPKATKFTKANNNIVTIPAEVFDDSLVVFTAEHDIVKILNPINAINYGEDDEEEDDEDYEDEDDEDDDDEDDDDEGDDDEDDDDERTDFDIVTFIVLADVKENGDKVDQGLYMLKNGQATKLLDNGRDAAAADDDTKTAYFAAKDGIYSYNAAENKAEKYGTVTDDLISIAKVNGSDVIYALTADNVLLRVTEAGTKKEVVDKVVKAKEIVLDYQNNLYYYTNEKNVYVLVGDEVRKIEGLPANPSYLNMINPPYLLQNGVPIIVDNKSYIVNQNGLSVDIGIELEVRPTAYSMEEIFIQYYGYNKKVYEYNFFDIIF